MFANAAATGFVLAGGSGARMGQDKVLLPWGDSTLLEEALRKLRAVCGEVRICANRMDLGVYASVIPDAIAPDVVTQGAEPEKSASNKSIGPLGGIVAALEATATEWNLFLPVDLPLLPVEFLTELLERAHSGAAWAVIPCLAGRPQPLCAVYHRDLLPGLGQAVAEGKFKVMLALEFAVHATQNARLPDSREGIDRWDIPLSEQANWFLNLNTPEELEQAHRLFLRR